MLLQMAVDNILTDTVGKRKHTDEPSRLDLVFTIIESVKYKSPLGKSDHIVIELILNERREMGKGKSTKLGDTFTVRQILH